MDELIHLVNSPDQQAFLSALDTLAIPKPHDWLAAHFSIYAVDVLQKDYEHAFAGYRSHVWWVMGLPEKWTCALSGNRTYVSNDLEGNGR